MKKILVYLCLFLPLTVMHVSAALLPQNERKHALSPEELPRYTAGSLIGLFHEKDAWVDSLYQLRVPQVVFTNLNTLYIRYSREGFQAVKEPLHNYYNHIVDHMPAQQRREELERMKAVVASIGDPSLGREVDYMEVLTLPDDTEEETEHRLQQYEKLARKYEARGDVEIEMRALRYIFLIRERQSRYAESFNYARRIVALLEKTPPEKYPDAYDNWYMLGHAYYKFHDYDLALSYIRRSLVDTAKVFFFRSNLEARQLLAEHARDMNDLAESDDWYLSILHSPDIVNGRRKYNCAAMEGLARNLRLRGMYHEALQLCRAAWPLVHQRPNYGLIPDYAMNMGENYLALDDLTQAAAMIDTASLYIEKAYPVLKSHLQSRFYPLLSHYYARQGAAEHALAFADSANAVNRRIADRLNTMFILRNEQEQYAIQQQLNEEKLTRHRRIITATIAGICLLIFLLITILYLYRKRQRAYRELVRKSREWAGADNTCYTPNPGIDEEDRTVMDAIFDLLHQESIYRDPNLNRENLAELLHIHRNIVSKAINHTQQKNFNQFINEYRLREAIDRLSDPTNQQSIADIAADCGFNSHPTFYRLFKTETGLSPAQFRKNSKD